MRAPNQSTFAKPHFCIRRAKTHFMSTNRSPKLFCLYERKIAFPQFVYYSARLGFSTDEQRLPASPPTAASSSTTKNASRKRPSDDDDDHEPLQQSVVVTVEAAACREGTLLVDSCLCQVCVGVRKSSHETG